jgi:molybdenum cofactor guanylyltransferase
MATPDQPPDNGPDHPIDAAYDAVILAGGAARRLGGADKPGLAVGGRSLVGWAAAAVPGARRLILVGPERPELPGAIVVREDPPGSGPVAAVRAGLAMVTSPWLVLLAADLPFLRPEHVGRLLAAARDETCEAPGVVGEDAGGRSQWLLGGWYTPALRAALGRYEGFSLHGLMEPMRPGRVRLPEASRDCDTPEDLDRAVTALEGTDRAR